MPYYQLVIVSEQTLPTTVPPLVKPSVGDQVDHHRQDETVQHADGELLGEQPADVARGDLVQSQPADGKRQGLAAGDSAHAGNHGHQHRQGDDPVDGVFEQPDHPGREEYRHQVKSGRPSARLLV